MSESISPDMMGRLLALHEVRVPLTVGRATVAWNTLSGEVFEHFSLLSGMDHEAAKAVFFTVASDRSQRDMVSRLFAMSLAPHSPNLAKRGKSLLGDADKLSGKRNDILHVVFVDGLNPAAVRQLQERGHLKGKAGADLLDAIDAFATACLDLTLSLMKLRGDILNSPHYQSRALAAAVLEYSARRKAGGWASQAEFGLIDFPATTQRSPDETQG